MIQGSTDHRTHTGVHAGGIAAAGKYTDTFDTHNEFLLTEDVDYLPYYCIADSRKSKDIFHNLDIDFYINLCDDAIILSLFNSGSRITPEGYCCAAESPYRNMPKIFQKTCNQLATLPP
jgi:hypothetical protein